MSAPSLMETMLVLVDDTIVEVADLYQCILVEVLSNLMPSVGFWIMHAGCLIKCLKLFFVFFFFSAASPRFTAAATDSQLGVTLCSFK